MPDPITSAIAGSVASKAIEGIIDVIESSEDPEEAWKRSGLEIAIQAESAYKYGIESGGLQDLDRAGEKLDEFGEMAQQLAIRGELRGFDEEYVDILEDFSNTIATWVDTPFDDMVKSWNEMVDPNIIDIKTNVNIE